MIFINHLQSATFWWLLLTRTGDSPRIARVTDSALCPPPTAAHEAEVDAEFAIPPEVLQAALASPALLRVPISYQGEGLILTGETTPPAQELISVTESVITVQQKFERQVQQPLLVEENALTTKSPP